MDPFIKLKKSETAIYVVGRTQGYRFTLEVLEAVGLPLEIFVYQRKPIISNTAYEDAFVNIASPGDLEEYPVGAPACAAKPFFRLSVVDLVFRSISLAEDAWTAIQGDIDQLIETMKFMNNLSVEEEVSFGTAPVESSSSSSPSAPVSSSSSLVSSSSSSS